MFAKKNIFLCGYTSRAEDLKLTQSTPTVQRDVLNI